MKIDAIGSAAGAASYQNMTQPVTKVAAPEAPEKVALDESAVQSARPDAVNAAVSGTDANGSANSQNDSEKQKKQQETSMKDVNSIGKLINRNTVAEFGFNEPTNRITIKIKDKETDEVIREIPSDKALEMLAKAWELAGIMVDEKR